MQSSATENYKWIKNRAKRKPVHLPIIDQKATSNAHARLDAITQVWKKIYSIHQHGEPSKHEFLRFYGETLRSHNINLPEIHPDAIWSTLRRIRPSAAGLDHFLPQEIKIITYWCPDMVTHLAAIYNLIEATGQWPSCLTKGMVAFLPKTNDPNPQATDFRPLTILSSIYRLWASIRHDNLCEHWLPHWKSEQAFGLKQAHAADALAYQTCIYMSEASRDGVYAAGLSYDFAKCFDTVPVDLALHIFNIRGADCKVIKALSGIYHQHTKYFKLDGAYSAEFCPYNSIIQGCPLSMILLTSLVTTWIEFVQHMHPTAVPRSYADDLSITTSSSTKSALKTQIISLYTAQLKDSLIVLG